MNFARRFTHFRVTPESDVDDDLDGSVLSLGLFPGEYIDGGGDERTLFRYNSCFYI